MSSPITNSTLGAPWGAPSGSGNSPVESSKVTSIRPPNDGSGGGSTLRSGWSGETGVLTTTTPFQVRNSKRPARGPEASGWGHRRVLGRPSSSTPSACPLGCAHRNVHLVPGRDGAFAAAGPSGWVLVLPSLGVHRCRADSCSNHHPDPSEPVYPQRMTSVLR